MQHTAQHGLEEGTFYYLPGKANGKKRKEKKL
jgi:hypothetical protein